MGTCTHDIDFIADKVRSHISPIHISSCPGFIFPPYQIQGSILANLTKLQLSVHMSNSHLELD